MLDHPNSNVIYGCITILLAGLLSLASWIAAPAIWIMTAWTFQKIFEWKAGASNYVAWLKYTIMILLIALPVRYCIERLKPFEHIDRRRPQLVSLSNSYGSHVVLINAQLPIREMFFGAVTAYEKGIDSATAARLSTEGWIVIGAGKAGNSAH